MLGTHIDQLSQGHFQQQLSLELGLSHVGKAAIHLSSLEDLLFNAGCSDALICSYNNTVYLKFDRSASSADKAISSAMADIKQAGLSIGSIEEGGVASMAEMANRARLTRAAINNYSKSVRGPGTFPEPLFGLTSGSPYIQLTRSCPVATPTRQDRSQAS